MTETSNEEGRGQGPAQTAGDTCHALGRAALSAIPFVGGPAAELFGHFVSGPLSKRVMEWREEIGTRLQELESNKGISLQDLQENEGFMDTLLHASNVAVRTSSDRKREALRNAIVNAASPSAPDEAEQVLFVDYIDRFTDWHLRILQLFLDPAKWAEDNNITFTHSEFASNLGDLLERAYPDLRGRREFYDQVWFQLNQAGLVKTDTLHSMMSTSGVLASRTTELGRRFLDFVSAP